MGKQHKKRWTRLYTTWTNLKARCSNKKHPAYKNYGGRGITFCDEWITFMPFYDWAMSNGYNDKLSLDRIDNNGNYEPNNCQWVSRKVQNRNTRKTKNVTINNITYCLKDWADIYNINYTTLLYRIRRGWDEVRAVTTPVKKI